MLRIRVSRAALQDFEAIALYTDAQWGRDQRLRYMTEIENRLVDLRRHPQAAPSRADIRGGYRAARVASHVIYFQVVGDCLELVRVLHARMDPTRHLPDA
jgi:toxin ParE1/3/4